MSEGKFFDVAAHMMWSIGFETEIWGLYQFVICLSRNDVHYHIYSKYWDTLIPYHTCPIICKSLFHYLLMY